MNGNLSPVPWYRVKGAGLRAGFGVGSLAHLCQARLSSAVSRPQRRPLACGESGEYVSLMHRLLIVLLLFSVPGLGGAAKAAAHEGARTATSSSGDDDRAFQPSLESTAERGDERRSMSCGMPDCTSMSGCTSTTAALSPLTSLHLNTARLMCDETVPLRLRSTPRASLPPPPKV